MIHITPALALIAALQLSQEDLTVAFEQAAGSNFWGAAIVARDGEIVLSEGRGLGDLDKNAFTTASYVDIGGISMQFTAAAILKLEAKHKLSTADSIDEHLEHVPADKTGITVHHFLTHSSGLGSVQGLSGAVLEQRGAMVQGVLDRPLLAQPDLEKPLPVE
jgi:CubicO group peptidase (beta-lactamase class C family)